MGKTSLLTPWRCPNFSQSSSAMCGAYDEIVKTKGSNMARWQHFCAVSSFTLTINVLTEVLKEKFSNEIEIINDDILKVSENKISDQKLSVFGNLPYNISTEILSKWILNIGSNFWFESLVLMFQKEVADRIISEFNNSKYGRLSILSSWKLNVKKIIDIKPQSFSPRPKIDSSLLLFTPKENFFELKDPKNLEKITRIFFSQRRKMLKKPFNQVFANGKQVAEKFGIDLNLRPQNLEPETYFKLVKEYEDLRG